MYANRVPVDLIVPEIVHKYPVNEITADWRIEEAALSAMLVAHFKSMGIFFCEPNHRELFLKIIVFQLKYSPQILSAVAKAARDEESVRRNQIAI